MNNILSIVPQVESKEGRTYTDLIDPRLKHKRLVFIISLKFNGF